jgi:hypothetical protein
MTHSILKPLPAIPGLLAGFLSHEAMPAFLDCGERLQDGMSHSSTGWQRSFNTIAEVCQMKNLVVELVVIDALRKLMRCES